MLWNGWEAATLRDYHSYIDYNDPAWLRWWGRTGFVPACALHRRRPRRPDDAARLPARLQDRAGQAGRRTAFFKNKPDTRVVELPNATVRTYLVSGSRSGCATSASTVFVAIRSSTSRATRARVENAGLAALADWKAKNPQARSMTNLSG